MTSRMRTSVACFLVLLFSAGFAGAQDGGEISGADTAWILVASALVLFMTIPGLSLFYAGLVHKRNVLSVLMHCIALTGLMSILWLVAGYSLAFSGDGQWIGNLDKMFLWNVPHDQVLEGGSIPEVLFFTFQMTFFVITPALIVGTFVERVKFSAVLLFSALWGFIVYIPICHMTWDSDGYFFKKGVLDLAGGVVVHITAGIAALVFCIVIGKRHHPQPPHNLPMALIGTGMLWVGWFGFNGGSWLAADWQAALSITVTHISAATAALTWMLIEWFLNRKPSVLGIATGAIAGLAAITPAAGVSGPVGALIIGATSGAVCWFVSVKVKNALKFDDSLDVFGVHGIGGIVGTILAAVVGLTALNGVGYDNSFGGQLSAQIEATLITIVYSAIATYVIIKVVDLLVGLRVDENEERVGLDQASHGETGSNE